VKRSHVCYMIYIFRCDRRCECAGTLPRLYKSTVFSSIRYSKRAINPHIQSFETICRYCLVVEDNRNTVTGPVWPGVLQEVYAPRFPGHSAHEGGKVVSLTHRPPSSPGLFLVLIFTRGWVEPRAMVGSEGICQ